MGQFRLKLVKSGRNLLLNYPQRLKKQPYIKNTSNDRFSNLIKPYLFPSLQYKLNSTCHKLTLLNNSNRKYSTNTKYSNNYKKEYELSTIQKEALIGIILGVLRRALGKK